MNPNDSRPFLGLITALESETRALCGNVRTTVQGHFLRAETHCAQGRVVCLQCGPGPERALAAGRELATQGAGVLLCAGVASGIDPETRCGELLLGNTVCLLHENLPLAVPNDAPSSVETALRLLAEAKMPARSRPLLTTANPLLDAEERRHWFETTGAAAVDTESAGVALAAMEAKLPFLAVRAVSDSVSQPVSKEMIAACDNGAIGSAFGLIRTILQRPSLFGEFWRAGREYARALDALKKARKALFQACFESLETERMETPDKDADTPEEQNGNQVGNPIQ
ncbi:MAG: hypothetical protein AB7E32_00970 [Desulfovibrio sp.]